MNAEKQHMLDCLARELLTWKLSARRLFLSNYEKRHDKETADKLREALTEQHALKGERVKKLQQEALAAAGVEHKNKGTEDFEDRKKLYG